jgi:TonB family protein
MFFPRTRVRIDRPKLSLRDGVHMATQASDTANSTASKRARGASPDDLAVVAQRAQAFTNASGVAIALSEGNADEIVCRARSGASAPEVGAALRVEGTFTGLCIQSGKELRCDDCETDTRVDTAAIRALGIRSMVVAPIREDSRVVGVLAAFAPTPHAFTITHVAVLKTMGDQISQLLQKERRAREENPQAQAETPRPAAPVIAAKPVIAATPAPVVPAVVIKPSTPAPRAAAPVVSKVEPIKSMPVEVVPLAAPTKREEKRSEFAPRATFGTFDSVAAEEKKPANRMMMIGVVAVLVIAAGATFAFLKMQKSGSAQRPVQEAANVPPVQPAPVAPSGSVQPGSPGASGLAQPGSSGTSNASSAPAASKPAAEVEARRTARPSPEKTSSAPAEKPAPAEKVAVVATLAGSGPSRITQNSGQGSSDIAPSLTVMSGNTGAPLSSLARPVASSTPSAAAIEQSNLEPMQLIRAGTPIYPAIAKARSITGTVVVQGTVGKDGKITNLQFISGPPIFKDAAFEAVRVYLFKPAKLNGQPIEQVTQVKLNFH